MGDSAPPPAVIDLVGTYARRRGLEAELVLWDPKAAHSASSVTLIKGSSQVTGSVRFVEDEAGKRLVARVPLKELTDGIWRLRLNDGSEAGYLVESRLLVQGQRPLVLLWGAKAGRTEVPGRTKPKPRRQAAAAAGRALDRALRPLPPDQALKVRTGIRKTAQRVLG